MATVHLYHNPRCTKSRQTLALLQAKGITPTIRLYLEDTLSPQEIKTLLKELDMGIRDVLRGGEAAYQEMNLDDKSLTDDELITAVSKAPELMQRPVVSCQGNARIGRPPENVLDILP